MDPEVAQPRFRREVHKRGAIVKNAQQGAWLDLQVLSINISIAAFLFAS